MNTYNLQIIPYIGATPFWVKINAQSETEAHTIYYSNYPSHSIVWTKLLEQ